MLVSWCNWGAALALPTLQSSGWCPPFPLVSHTRCGVGSEENYWIWLNRTGKKSGGGGWSWRWVDIFAFEQQCYLNMYRHQNSQPHEHCFHKLPNPPSKLQKIKKNKILTLFLHDTKMTVIIMSLNPTYPSGSMKLCLNLISTDQEFKKGIYYHWPEDHVLV